MKVSLPNKEKLEMLGNLGTMLSSGIPIVEALDSLREEAKGNQKKVLDHLHKDINAGKTIADSLEELDRAFDPITINLIRAAEESGNLDTTLKDITVHIKKNMEFSSKVRAALIYPSLVFVLFLGIMVVILTYVIPRIAEVFIKLKIELPLSTRILIVLSDFFLANTLAIVIVTTLLIIALIILYRTKKRELMNILFSLPLFKQLATAIDMAQFTNNLSVLLQSGIPIVKAMEFSKKVVLRRQTEEAIEKARFMVSGGKTLATGFEKSPKVFPSVVIRITEAGEKSGTLENAMKELSERFETRVEEALKTITTVLEPAMLVVIGLFVGGIMLSIIAPIYQLIGDISPR